MKNLMRDLTLLTCFCLVADSAFSQNTVTYIPKDKPNVKTDTSFTVIDQKKDLRYYEAELADQTVEKGYLQHGKKQGNIMRYFANGVLLSLTQFENGSKNGVYLECDKSGVVLREENYLNDKLDGEVKIYASSKGVRIVKSSYHYKEGKFNGIQTEYNDMGRISSEASYLNGKKNGLSKWYFAGGQIAMEQGYIDDKIEGSYKTYNQAGNVVAQGQYINGKKMGTWLEYNDNGTLRSQGDYKDDVKTGAWKYFDENGNIQKSENF